MYEWDNLHAEACSIYGAMGSGGLIETVTLAVLEPGTRKVIDRFHFAHELQQGEMYWAMAQLFMQQSPQGCKCRWFYPDWNPGLLPLPAAFAFFVPGLVFPFLA